jgi:hypothetical protein|tara:strand:- start:3601 stop:3948 length:348 start_codon:yes stop_codon:yes gene_type:complete
MVKIYEVTEIDQKDNEELGFDLIDDASVWMRNDAQFYRKEFFPTMSKVADKHREGVAIDRHKLLGPMVEKGINRYCATYDLPGSPDQIVSQQDRHAIIDRLFSEEMDQIEKGDYK